LANSPQARKRARQADKSRTHNAAQRSAMRTSIKNVVYAIEKGDKEAAQTAYNICAPMVDRMSNKGIIHANKAARHKSRMNTQIKSL